MAAGVQALLPVFRGRYGVDDTVRVFGDGRLGALDLQRGDAAPPTVANRPATGFAMDYRAGDHTVF